MISFNSQQLKEILSPLQSPETSFEFNGVEIDSRKDCKGTLFVAISGENFDGHDYVGNAADKGAIAALVERRLDVSIPQIVVVDTRAALGLLANAWRKRLQPLVVAITGSNGKTTVKEMLARILSSQQQTLKTAGNLNNEIGVPLTLFRLSPKDRYAVIEMGANHAGEIRQLVSIAAPDVVLVNNARAAHVEGFGSLDAVVRAKGEMYQYATADAIAVFNDDEPAVELWKSLSAAQQRLLFSSAHDADVTVDASNTAMGMRLQVSYQGQQAHSEINVRGAHNVQNALAAISLALACGLTLQQATSGLKHFGGVKGRQQFFQGVHDSLIIDDSYNANPDSLAAAVQVLCSLQGSHWLALGDMAELGEHSLAMHRKAVSAARAAGVEQFFALGEQSCESASIFGDQGYCFSQHDEMAEFIGSRLHRSVNLLVKGSRSAHMEKLVQALVLSEAGKDQQGGTHAL